MNEVVPPQNRRNFLKREKSAGGLSAKGVGFLTVDWPENNICYTIPSDTHKTKRMGKLMSLFMHRCFQRKFPAFCLTLWLGVVLPLVGISSVAGSKEDLENRSLASLAYFKPVQKEKLSGQLSCLDTWYGPGRFLLVNRDVSPPQNSPDFSSERTGPALVGSIMALLATFEAANVLPLEGTSKANQLIHGLIQLQSALVKSQSSALNEYVSTAVDSRFEMERAALLQSIHQSGLTSKVLEALLFYDQKMPILDQPAIAHIFQRYNLSRQDWQLLEQIFAEADTAYRAKGSSIHKAYEQWRLQMPGGR